jgi:hypothetical protein
MKHVKSFGVFENNSGLSNGQINFLSSVVGGTWTLNPTTGLVDVDGEVNIKKFRIVQNQLKVKFGVVTGGFSCSDVNIKSLEGSPIEVGGDFKCSRNPLTSLVGSPQKVNGGFYCTDTKIVDLVGSPRYVGRSFYAVDNNFSSFEGAPKTIGGRFATDEVAIEKGDWNLDGFTKGFESRSNEGKKLILSLLDPKYINRLVEENPEETIVRIKEIWNNPGFSKVRKSIIIPEKWKKELEVLSDLSELGF